MLLDLLNSYHPTAQDEQQFKAAILAFVHAHPNDCFKRELQAGHITASAWLLSKSGNEALLMHHRKLDQWFQLGGHCDGEADVMAVAIKEAQEESGITHVEAVNRQIFDIDVHLIPATSKDPAHYHYDVRFLLQVKSDEQRQINSESKELRWVAKERQLLPTTSRSVTRMFDKWIALP